MIKHRHFVLNKPFGCLSQFVNNRNRKKQLLGDLYPFPKGTMAIGRLDAKSEGLLLLTTDGQLSEYIRTAKVEKEYFGKRCFIQHLLKQFGNLFGNPKT